MKTNTIVTFFLFGLLMTMLSACDNSSNNRPSNNFDKQLALDNAMNKWEISKTDYYTFHFEQSCECILGAGSPLNVSVINNSILSARYSVNNVEVDAGIRDNINTVEDIFNLIQQAINQDISIQIEYNVNIGYPELVMIDLDAIAADGGLNIRLMELEFGQLSDGLDDVVWQLKAFNTIAGPQLLVENTIITLQFEQDDLSITGNAGCGNYAGNFLPDNNTMAIFGVFTTEMACSHPFGIMEQEQTYITYLENVNLYSFISTELYLDIGVDAGLHFVRAE